MSEQTDRPEEELYYDQRSVALRTTQNICFVQEYDKVSMLELLLEEYQKTQVVIVVRSKKKADELNEFLNSKEFNALAIHGNHRRSQQEEAATAFNLGTLNIIITTDMIFKTLELENIKLLLSYNLPDMWQDYYNRVALMKENGIAIALISPEDEQLLSDIEFNMKDEIKEKIIEGFVALATSNHTEKSKKDRTKKPRHHKTKKEK